MQVQGGKIHSLTIGSTENNTKKSTDSNIGFKDFLNKAVYSVSDMEKKSDEMNFKFISGEVDNIHEVMIATQKADIAIQAFTEVKSKIMDAYKEIMRIQI
ncbi:flagellar hook-basal body complex protein FliE [Tepidibacter hydrothermalis]|uniref:Flagellar hook-basal body complex protein FliE n=1 Tax=Tepidibacter hydrothermalis TaxID=3036126 RepID=A0ABY8EFF7_9FIRM|nr:flagellar hook-basal body complex protein FliE [Tepidibacter hydrothermalis]WFD11673.1 flagellar hook-basal body complex protein FliE [Tepidibacter hydrothermalis]